ncbi:uncharacterized protein CBL_10271 [Carabus blaptoides fortunei]
MLSFNNGTSGVLLQTFFMLAVQNQNDSNDIESNTLYYQQIGKEINATKCYGAYGCFPISAPWTSEHRPVSLFPEYPEKISPGFWLYKTLDQEIPFIFDLDDIDTVQKSEMNVHQPIYVITHGYLEAGNRLWIRTLRRELLKREACSVIVIDWGGGSSPPYTQAVANIRLVGAMMAHLLEMVSWVTGAQKLDHVHVIGHSLGAHLSGYIGYALLKQFNLTLGRITGLDPAEPHFAHAGKPVRLTPEAAKYVDVIHTDANGFIHGGLGIIERVGHVDFYPNGGTDQPGCGKGMVEYISAEQGSFVAGLRRFLGCNHVRSYEFFTESISSQCEFLAITCESYEAFKNGSCFECEKGGNHCIKFGYHSRKWYQTLVKQRKIKDEDTLALYMMTNPASPFCRGHYRITVTISNTNESKVHGGEIGQLWFTAHSRLDENNKGAGANSGRFALNNGRYHEPGVTYRTVVPATAINDIKAVTLEWQYHSSMFNPLTWRLLTAPRIYVTRVTIDSLESGKSITVCPKQVNKPLITHSEQVWLPTYCTKVTNKSN